MKKRQEVLRLKTNIQILPAAVLLTAVLLCGCSASAQNTDAKPENAAAVETAIPEPAAESAPEAAPEPTPTPVPELSFPDGSVHKADEKELDLSWLSHKDVAETVELLKKMPDLETVELGTDGAWTGVQPELTEETASVERPEAADRDLSWKDLRSLQEAAPDAEFLYKFCFYGREFTTQDEAMDLNHSTMTDNGEAVRDILPLMKHCRYLDMDSCGVPSEEMAKIRDAYPDMDVVWRIWFANDMFTVRTDIECLWCANFYPYMYDMYTQDLKYCTKLKYLDLGHNTDLHDWSFLEYMPDLEVLIITASGWDTLDMLKNCTKMEFLEIVPMGRIELDLHPLAGMTDLEYLNMCGMGKTEGWEVLLNMPKLKRLWIGRATAYWFPEGAMEQILETHPDTQILYKEDGAATGSWRINPDGTVPERYTLLRQQFDYDHWPEHAPYPYNDPLYEPPWKRPK